jgi:hypothetical protein
MFKLKTSNATVRDHILTFDCFLTSQFSRYPLPLTADRMSLVTSPSSNGWTIPFTEIIKITEISNSVQLIFLKQVQYQQIFYNSLTLHQFIYLLVACVPRKFGEAVLTILG